MQEFFIMIGLSFILAVAAFAETPSSTSAPSTRISQRPVVPTNGTATFLSTSTAISTSTGGNVRVYTNEATQLPTGVGTSVPQPPPKMPPEPTKPTGFN